MIWLPSPFVDASLFLGITVWPTLGELSKPQKKKHQQTKNIGCLKIDKIGIFSKQLARLPSGDQLDKVGYWTSTIFNSKNNKSSYKMVLIFWFSISMLVYRSWWSRRSKEHHQVRAATSSPGGFVEDLTSTGQLFRCWQFCHLPSIFWRTSVRFGTLSFFSLKFQTFFSDHFGSWATDSTWKAGPCW